MCFQSAVARFMSNEATIEIVRGCDKLQMYLHKMHIQNNIEITLINEVQKTLVIYTAFKDITYRSLTLFVNNLS